MRLTSDGLLRIAKLMICLIVIGLAMGAHGQAVKTTTVQGTVYMANGQPGGGTLTVNWPAFTTAAGQLVAADRTSVTIGSDGFVSINLAPNQGSLPAGEYYTAVFYMSDGSVNTQYWVVPAAAQATLAQIQAQVMPAVQAVQAVSKAYVDQEIAELTGSLLTASGGNLSGPLYLNGDPTQPLQAADITVKGGFFAANIGTTLTSGYLFNTNAGGNGMSLNVADTTWGTPANVVVGASASSNPQGLNFQNNFGGGIPISSGVIPKITAASTITTNGNRFVELTGTTPINTITSTLMPGEILTVKAVTNGVNFGASGNVNSGCFSAFPTLNAGQTARLTYDDALTSGTLYLLDTSAGSCGFSFGSSQKMTGVQGTGTAVQAASGSAFTSGDFLSYDSNGNAWDSGVNASGLPVTLGRLTSPVVNTGSTSAVQRYSLMIPANAVTASGTLKIMLGFGACTGSGAPFAGCTAANTGTCTPTVYLATSSTGNNYPLMTSPAITAAKPAVTNISVQQQGSLNSEVSNNQTTYGTSIQTQVQAPTANMGNATYLNVFMANSVSADQCYLTQVNTQAQP